MTHLDDGLTTIIHFLLEALLFILLNNSSIHWSLPWNKHSMSLIVCQRINSKSMTDQDSLSWSSRPLRLTRNLRILILLSDNTFIIPLWRGGWWVMTRGRDHPEARIHTKMPVLNQFCFYGSYRVLQGPLGA